MVSPVVIGVPRFELGTSPTRTERATRMRHTPGARRVATPPRLRVRLELGTEAAQTRHTCTAMLSSSATEGGTGERGDADRQPRNRGRAARGCGRQAARELPARGQPDDAGR